MLTRQSISCETTQPEASEEQIALRLRSKSNELATKLVQFSLIFVNPSADHLSKYLTSFGSHEPYRIVYMGTRHVSNIKAFKAYCATSNSELVEESYLYGHPHIKKYDFVHRNQHEKFFSLRICEYRLFTGMNPTIKTDDLKFDSNFQCGNLDLAICVQRNQYDLIMRVDSNTRGHTAWFFFKVSNFSGKQKVKFNLINFQKRRLSYKDGMRPYCFTSSRKQWTQQGLNVEYRALRFRYNTSSSSSRNMCLSFSFQFQKEDTQVYFAYCVPYSYSYLMHFLNEIKKDYPHTLKISLEQESSGGLLIPVLTVTNMNQTEKSTCLCTARLHPGETQGSWMIEGFIKSLLSPKGHELRQRVVFNIIPMLNVDGVVLGNFRTGISGKDLNRAFSATDTIKEVALVRKLALQYRPFLYLDFHGHSSKKNVFTYGPDYSLQHKYYLPARLLPKIISQHTEAFRYYSCIFRISDNKVNTGRAIMLKQHHVVFSFTVETSAYCYKANGKTTLFKTSQYLSIGEQLAVSLSMFVRIVLKIPRCFKRRQSKYQRQGASEASFIEQAKKDSLSMEEQITYDKKCRSRADSKFKVSSNNVSEQDNFILNIEQFGGVEGKILKELLLEKQCRKEMTEQSEQASSDSDCEDASNDYTDKELQQFFVSSYSLVGEPQKNLSMQIHRSQQSNYETIAKQKEDSKKPAQNYVMSRTSLRTHQMMTPPPNQDKTTKLSKETTIFQRHRNRNRALSNICSEQVFPCEIKQVGMFYKNWYKRKSESKNKKQGRKKLKSINQVTLNYNQLINKVYEPSAKEKLKEHLREKQIMRLRKHIKRQTGLAIKGQPLSSLNKRSILPVIHRNNYTMKDLDSSFMLVGLLDQQQQGSNKSKPPKLLYL